MFQHIPNDLLQRAMHPKIFYGRHILGESLQHIQATYGVREVTILTQQEPWNIACEHFADLGQKRLIYLHSMEKHELFKMEHDLPSTGLVVGLGGGQAMDAAKYVAWRRNIPLILVPTIVSVDAAVTNTIAIREEQKVRYIGFVIADAILVDLELITQAPKDLNRAGIGDLLSIHTALWDWKVSDDGYDAAIAENVNSILIGLEERIEAVGECDEAALRYIMDSYVLENTLCLEIGSSRPEEGSEHFLGYNIEFITKKGYVHGQLICLCTYVMAQLQDNRPDWVLAMIERARCPWRLSDLGINHDEFVEALLTLKEFTKAEGLPDSVISQRHITASFAKHIARECERG